MMGLPFSFDSNRLSYRFFKLAIANTLSNILVPLSGLITVAFLGHLPAIDHLAGIALATILFNFLYQAFSFLRMSTIGVTAQAVGRNDRPEMFLIALRNSFIALIFGLLLLILQHPIEQLGFRLLTATAEVKTAGLDYFQVRIWEAPAVLLNAVLMGWLLGREQSGKVLWLSAIANLTTLCLDYSFIVRLHWAEMGAGLSQVLTQYLILILIILSSLSDLKWQELKTILPEVFDRSALKSTLIFKRDLFISALMNVTTVGLFSGFSSTMGTVLFTQNALMVQIGQLTITFVGGLRNATATLAGIFKGEGAKQSLLDLVKISGEVSLLIGASFGATCLCFPETVFGLLTDSAQILNSLSIYLPWVLIILSLGAVSHSLEGYFLGLAQGQVIRNLGIMSSLVGFLPIALYFNFYNHTNHILWLAFTIYKVTKILVLSFQLRKTFLDPVNVPTLVEQKVA
jgi:MATE family multidrug resistance protein